jgi:hypothetical protein
MARVNPRIYGVEAAVCRDDFKRSICYPGSSVSVDKD